MVFYFREYAYDFCDLSVKEGRCNVNGFFFPPGGKKKNVPKPKYCLKPQKSPKAAIFVKNPKLSCKIGLMRGREENLFVLSEN